MQKEIYDGLPPREKAFADLLQQIAERLKRLADLMDRELQ